MAHRLLASELPVENRKPKSLASRIPHFYGRFGFSFYVGGREIFLGIAINPVTVEQVTIKRQVKIPKGTVKVFNFPNSE